MSRLSDAWAALCGRPRVVEVEKPVTVEKTVEVTKPVPVGDGVVTVFVARSRSFRELCRYHFGGPGASLPIPPKWQGRVYLSCAQAFAECGDDADLTPSKALLHGGKAYLFDSLTEHAVQPKPKRAKGAKA